MRDIGGGGSVGIIKGKGVFYFGPVDETALRKSRNTKPQKVKTRGEIYYIFVDIYIRTGRRIR